MRRLGISWAIALAVTMVMVRPAHAQMWEAVGIRAKGMGGAFVAVADDATAAWWNPAGLATGRLISITGERDRVTLPSDPVVTAPARRDTVSGFSLSYPGMAFSYYRLRVSEIAPSPPTGVTQPDRQDPEAGEVRLQELGISQYGLTVGQSLGNHFVLGTTLKLMRAGRAESIVVATSNDVNDFFDQAQDLDIDAESSSDIDVGVMAAFGRLRLGASLKHLKGASFGDGENRFELPRQARAGVAFLATTRGLVQAITLSADADILSTTTVRGDVRRIATGIEVWTRGRQVGLRTGINFDTVGDAETTGSVGLSVGVPGGICLESALLFGSDATRNGLSAGFSVTF